MTDMEKEYTVGGSNTLKIPYRPFWTIFCIDMEYYLRIKGLVPEVATDSKVTFSLYDWDSLPKEMSFKPVKGSRWSDQ